MGGPQSCRAVVLQANQQRMQTDHLGKAGPTGVMHRSGLKPSIQLLTSHAAEHASLPQRHHHTAANRTSPGSRVARDEKRLCGGPDSGSSRHGPSALVDLPANVCSMVEMRTASPWLRLGKFLDFLGGRETERNESPTRCALETKDDVI